MSLLATSDKKDGIIRMYFSWQGDTERRNISGKQRKKEIFYKLGRIEQTLPQQRKLGTAKHGTLDDFEFLDLGLDRPIAVG